MGARRGSATTGRASPRTDDSRARPADSCGIAPASIVTARSYCPMMRRKTVHHSSHAPSLPNLAALVLATLGLCSCRSVQQAPLPPLPSGEAVVGKRLDDDSVTRTVERTAHIPAEPLYAEDLPIPVTTVSPWSPPGIAGPWPHDEYLFDGGDRDVQVNVAPSGELQGVELEDTVAVYDTLTGETCVEPSNRVCLYSPRFAAVRKV